MDKLKPILAQKFWILSALCLLLPLTGWWLATGAMAVEITTRTKALDDAFKGIPAPGANKKWTERVDALNKEEEVKVKQTGDFLWNQQQELMTWPEVVKAGVEKGGFRGEIDAKTRSEYRTAYEVELVELHQVVKPFDPLTGAGLVEFPIELIPTQSWGSSAIPPSSQQMWDSQEDIWMFRTLLLGVANINEGFKSETVLDSKIKQINLIELRGGIPGGAKAVAEAAGSAGGPGGAGEGGAGPESRPGMAGGPGLGGLGGGVSGGADTLTHTFDPAEQFGSDAGAVEGAEAGAGPAGAGGAGPAGGPDDALKRGGMMAGGESAVKKRYIEETPRFKTRGFYMELVLDHRILPEFIAELSDSKWPLRVIRVQAVDCNLDDIAPDAAIGGGSGGTGGAGRGRAMGGGGPGRGAAPRQMRDPKMGGGAGGRGARPGAGVGRPAVGDGTSPENLVDLQSAMADPYLVNVALSGIITLYLPPEAAAGAPPGTEGTPATPPAAGDPTAATTPPAAAPGATDPTAATPVAGAPVGAAVAPPGGDAAAKPGTAATPPAGTPAAETKPATGAKPAADTKPAAETKTKSAAETKPAADPKPEAKPAAEAKPPADGKPTVPPPATPDPAAKPPATPPAGAANPVPAATPPAKPEAPAAAKP